VGTPFTIPCKVHGRVYVDAAVRAAAWAHGCKGVCCSGFLWQMYGCSVSFVQLAYFYVYHGLCWFQKPARKLFGVFLDHFLQ